MIKLKNILLEKDEKSDSENPDKMLVKNKESGKSYYISKDSFDPSKHEKSGSADKKKDKSDEKETASSEKKSDEKSVADSSDPIAAAFGAIDKKQEKAKEKKAKEKEKKLSPSEKLEKKLGSYVFLDDKEREEIVTDVLETRPDIKKKLLKFEFTSFFRDYDDLLDVHATQVKSDDKEGAKKTMKEIRNNAKRIQGIAIAKLAVVSKPIGDEKIVNSVKHYHSSSDSINKFLRTGNAFGEDTILSNDEIEVVRNDMKVAREKGYIINQRYTEDELKAMETINNMDDYFDSQGSILDNDTTVFRGVTLNVLDKFIEANEWIDNGYTSTSLNPLIAENFTYTKKVIDGVTMEYGKQKRPALLKMKLKRGMRVLSLPCAEDEFCIETELTLPRGCKFRIASYDKKNNIYNVEVEQPNE
jgi:hypothetical protein